MSALPLPGRPMVLSPRTSPMVQQLASSLMARQATPVTGTAGAIANFGAPIAGALFSELDKRRATEETEAETTAMGRMLREAADAAKRGQDPIQAAQAMAAVQEGPGWAGARGQFNRMAQMQLAQSLTQQGKPYTLSPGQRRYNAQGQLVASAPAAPRPPQVREVKQGNRILTQQFDPGTSKWTTISTAPRYKPQEGAAYTPQTPVGKALRDREELLKAGRGPNDPIIRALDRQIAKTGQISGEAMRAQEMVRSGGQTLRSVTKTLMPGGKLDEKAVAGMWANLPRTQGRTARAQMEEVTSMILRLETGAQANEQEIKNTMDRYMPTPFDNPATARDKLQRLNRRFRNARDIAEGRQSDEAQLPVPGEPAPSPGAPPIAQAGVVPAPEAQGLTVPAPGTIQEGYEFLGGDPADQRNWRPVR